jgi:hypothetical protein
MVGGTADREEADRRRREQQATKTLVASNENDRE